MRLTGTPVRLCLRLVGLDPGGFAATRLLGWRHDRHARLGVGHRGGGAGRALDCRRPPLGRCPRRQSRRPRRSRNLRRQRADLALGVGAHTPRGALADFRQRRRLRVAAPGDPIPGLTKEFRVGFAAREASSFDQCGDAGRSRSRERIDDEIARLGVLGDELSHQGNRLLRRVKAPGVAAARRDVEAVVIRALERCRRRLSPRRSRPRGRWRDRRLCC